jgi:hypothetical protein
MESNNWETPMGAPTERLLITITRLMPVAADWVTASELLPHIGGGLNALILSLDSLVKRGLFEVSYGARGVGNRPVRIYRAVGGNHA